MSRLLDPKANGKFPFDYKTAAQTDVRATWDKLCPGWRDRKPNKNFVNVNMGNGLIAKVIAAPNCRRR